MFVKPSNLKIIQRDRTNVTVVGELKDVLIRFSSNPKVHQVIGIVVVDIPKFYGLLFSRDWSKKLHDYFATDWSHLWLPKRGQTNYIKINRERYMKYIVIDLNDSNDPFTVDVNTIEAQGMNIFFRNSMTEISTITNPEQQSEILAHTQITVLKNDPNIVDDDEIWSLYFDGSKSHEGFGVGCVFIDPIGNNTFITCQLEFYCTNNTEEYEALL
jgi:hypothetical protein